MEPNEIHAEIRATRDALMRECGGDLNRFWNLCRTRQAYWVSAGHPVVSFEGQPPVELPPVDWEKVDVRPENEIITEIRAARRILAAERKSCSSAEADSLVIREEPPEK